MSVCLCPVAVRFFQSINSRRFDFDSLRIFRRCCCCIYSFHYISCVPCLCGRFLSIRRCQLLVIAGNLRVMRPNHCYESDGSACQRLGTLFPLKYSFESEAQAVDTNRWDFRKKVRERGTLRRDSHESEPKAIFRMKIIIKMNKSLEGHITRCLLNN